MNGIVGREADGSRVGCHWNEPWWLWFVFEAWRRSESCLSSKSVAVCFGSLLQRRGGRTLGQGRNYGCGCVDGSYVIVIYIIMYATSTNSSELFLHISPLF